MLCKHTVIKSNGLWKHQYETYILIEKNVHCSSNHTIRLTISNTYTSSSWFNSIFLTFSFLLFKQITDNLQIYRITWFCIKIIKQIPKKERCWTNHCWNCGEKPNQYRNYLWSALVFMNFHLWLWNIYLGSFVHNFLFTGPYYLIVKLSHTQLNKNPTINPSLSDHTWTMSKVEKKFR